MKINVIICCALVLTITCLTDDARAGVKSRSIRDIAKIALEKLGVRVEKEAIDSLASRMEAMAMRHGDDAITAVEKVGQKAIPLIEQAGTNGNRAARLIVQHGDKGLWIVSRPKSMALFVKYGDEAGQAMLRHPGIAESLITAHGRSAAEALTKLSAQNARRLRMMLDEGVLARIGRTDSLLKTIGQSGDRAMDFVWRNKRPLAITTGLVAFLADPQPFLDGARDLSQTTLEVAVRPVAEVSKVVATEAARRTNWTLIGAIAVVASTTLCGLRMYWRHRFALNK